MSRHLLARVPDVVFHAKDVAGRYVEVSGGIATRCGLTGESSILGRRPDEVCPGAHGIRFREQDQGVLRSGRALRDELELHPYPGGRWGWCLTTKEPVRTPGGRVVGVAGVSRDLGELESEGGVCSALARAVDQMRRNCSGPVRVTEVAAQTGLSLSRFERATRRIFGRTPLQILGRIRIDRAVALLEETDLTIAEIARRCGYSDHSAFTRQFRGAMGIPPSSFRTQLSARRAFEPVRAFP